MLPQRRSIAVLSWFRDQLSDARGRMSPLTKLAYGEEALHVRDSHLCTRRRSNISQYGTATEERATHTKQPKACVVGASSFCNTELSFHCSTHCWTSSHDPTSPRCDSRRGVRLRGRGSLRQRRQLSNLEQGLSFVARRLLLWLRPSHVPDHAL